MNVEMNSPSRSPIQFNAHSIFYQQQTQNASVSSCIVQDPYSSLVSIYRFKYQSSEVKVRNSYHNVHIQIETNLDLSVYIANHSENPVNGRVYEHSWVHLDNIRYHNGAVLWPHMIGPKDCATMASLELCKMVGTMERCLVIWRKVADRQYLTGWLHCYNLTVISCWLTCRILSIDIDR